MIGGLGAGLPVVAGAAVVVAAWPWAGSRPSVAGWTDPAGPSGRAVATTGAPPRWFVRLLGALDLPADPVVAWSASTVLAAGLGVAVLVAAPVLGVLGVGALVAAAAVRRRRPEGPGRRSAGDDDLVAALAAASAALRSGSGLVRALGRAAVEAGPLGRELDRVVAEAEAGTGVQAALDRWAAERPGSGVALVADALAIAGTTGADQAGALDAVAATLRDRQARRREVRALAAQARASAAVLVGLPAAFAVLVAAWDPRIARFLLATPAGWGCVAGGVVLDAVGGWWMARLIRAVR